MTQELSSVDREVLTTELERLLDELTEGQSQISVEYEDDNGGGKKALTITITPIDLNAPVEKKRRRKLEEDNDKKMVIMVITEMIPQNLNSMLRQ